MTTKQLIGEWHTMKVTVIATMKAMLLMKAIDVCLCFIFDDYQHDEGKGEPEFGSPASTLHAIAEYRQSKQIPRKSGCSFER